MPETNELVMYLKKIFAPGRRKVLVGNPTYRYLMHGCSA